jgi:hypothetical protein
MIQGLLMWIGLELRDRPEDGKTERLSPYFGEKNLERRPKDRKTERPEDRL